MKPLGSSRPSPELATESFVPSLIPLRLAKLQDSQRETNHPYRGDVSWRDDGLYMPGKETLHLSEFLLLAKAPLLEIVRVNQVYSFTGR